MPSTLEFGAYTPPRKPDALHQEASSIVKAVGGGRVRGSRERPGYIKHYTSESVRRYTALAQHVLDDQTPHLDSWILRSLSARNVVLQAVLHTIINQVASHFVRPATEKSIGVKVAQKDRKKSVTAASANEAERIEQIIFQGGVKTPHKVTGEPAVWDSHSTDEADPLEIAVRKIMRDSLVLDRAFVVTEGSLSGKEPVLFWKHVDGSLIRLVDTELYTPQVRNGEQSDDLTGKVKYVQLAADFDFRVDREYAWNEGYLSFRNPKPDLLSFGLGASEVEQCLAAVTGVLYTMQANQDWFTQNHVPQGLITLFGNFQKDDLAGLQDMLESEVGAVGGNIWRVPVMQAQPMQGNAVSWTPFVDRSRMDMVSKTYLELCVALIAAVFQIAPEEFGFHGFGGPSGTLGDGGTEDKLQHSQHKGLLPKVLWLSKFLSQAIVERINPDFELVVQGLDAVYNPEQLLKAQLDQALMANGLSINAIAARNDEPPIYDAIDEELWEEIKENHDGQYYPTERERLDTIAKQYKKQGGQLGHYPTAPVNNPGAMQIWMAEHLQEQQEAQQEMSGVAGQEAQGQQQTQQQEQLGAQQDLQAAGQREQENAFANDQADQEASRANEIRIPAQPDAAFGKAVRVYRLGPRDR